MLREVDIPITAREPTPRLDLFLRERLPSTTIALIRQAIAAGDVLLDGRPCRKGDRLRPGGRVQVRRLAERDDLCILPDGAAPLTLLREDSWLLALDKPAGQPVHPLRAGETGTLANALVARFPETASSGDTPLMGGLLHRIDTDTSGLVLAARTTEAYRRMRARFAARQVIKTYLALVTGEVTAPGRLEHLLAHKPSAPGVMVDARQLRAPPARPMRAVTGYRPLRRVGEGTLLEVDILTGVTHQIRCQLALAGHPILGDSRYGGPAREGFARHFLHATRLAFAHPLDDAPTVIEAPLPRELAALLD